MRERLPWITIQPDIDPKEFISRLENLIHNDKSWKIQNKKKITDDISYLVMTYQSDINDIARNLIAQFIYYPEKFKEKVSVELRAEPWIKPLTYDSYVVLINKLIKPILKIYNQTYGAKIRLSIASRKAMNPKIRKTVKNVFDFFCLEANKTALRTSDYHIFYGFIHASYKLDSSLTPDDIKDLLIEKGFHENQADALSTLYDHGRRLLSHSVGYRVPYDYGWVAELTEYRKLTESHPI